MENKFWMVIRIESANGPKKQHETLGDAIKEAARLASFYPGTYVVLEAVAKITAKVEKMNTEMTGYSDPTEG